MQYFVVNGSIDRSVHPEYNLALLDDFYGLHKLHATFTYNHPVYGPLSCRFNKPLKIPEGKEGGNGVVENIEIELVEMPGIGSSGETDLIQIEYEDMP
jgi:hypothetical protein